MSEWLPMSKAPRDGTRIIGWFGDRSIVVFWREGPKYIRRVSGHGWQQNGEKTWYWSDGYSRYPEPECWQSEPAPPDEGGLPRCDFCEARVDPSECKSRACPLKVAA
jgi:hypothetical protein